MGCLEYPESGREWAKHTGLIRTCPYHHLDFDVNVGCPQCLAERVTIAEEHKETKRETSSIQPLQECPKCKQKSLFRDPYNGQYECLNYRCKKVFAPGTDIR